MGFSLYMQVFLEKKLWGGGGGGASRLLHYIPLRNIDEIKMINIETKMTMTVTARLTCPTK